MQFDLVFKDRENQSNQHKHYYSFLKNKFKAGERTNLFDKLIDVFKLQKHLIRDFLRIMRTVECGKKIPMKDGLYDMLLKAIIGAQVCIVTNGNVQQQQNKVKHINWMGIKEKIKIYYANEIKPKPSNKIFLEIISKDFNLSEMDKILMIGDSAVDHEFALNINAEFKLIDHFF